MTQPIKIAQGGYADVWDLQNGTVLKAFRSQVRTHGQIVDMRDHDLLTSVFCAEEIRAYNSLKKVDDVKNYIPAFYGRQDPVTALPSSGDLYVKRAGFVIEKLKGTERKMAHLPEETRNVVEPILELISENLGGPNVWDCSCFYESDQRFKIIDFALWDALKFEYHLHEHGKFTEKQKYFLHSLSGD